MQKKTGSHPDFLSDGFDLPKVEEKVLEFWKTNGIFEKTLDPKRKKTFIFYEGPPYANGKPGIHHVLARVVKDIILRFKTMQGYRVPRKAGWDTHGLPVEIAAEKALGLKTKADIEKFGVKRFNEEAKKAVWLYKDEWERLTERIGYWLDLKNAYVTYSPDYIESIWWTLAQIAKKKLLYKGHKVVPWCSRCGTALSSHELAQGYAEVEDESVYLKFKVISKPHFKTDGPLYILSWTTTPWTLPGNVALAVAEKVKYALVRPRGQKETYVVAEELAPVVLKNMEYDVVGRVTGGDLVGLEYEPLFKIPALKNKAAYKVYPASFVTTTDGTGVVHTAVMYGEDDYQLGVKVGLPQHHTVTEDGVFKKEVPGGLAGARVKAKETEEKIFAHLAKNGTLLCTEKYKHEYPFCWRCGTPVLYFARDSWFIAMSKLRTELLKNNTNINWVPGHVKEGRFGEWLREVKDWNLSRERYWGAPLPIWECKKCGTHEVVGSVEELSARGSKAKNAYIALRHGEGEGNIKNIIDSGDQHFHLTTVGKDQAKQAGKKLKKEKIDIIIASDITRTKETANIVAKELGVKKIVFDKRLREVQVGSLSGKSVADFNHAYPIEAERFSAKYEPDAENLIDVRTRVWNLVRETEKTYSGKRILFVSHEDTIWMLAQIANGWTDAIAAEKKVRDRRAFIHPAEFMELSLKAIPRNDTGEVDLHRPFADEIAFPCAKSGCKGEMRRVPEVADVWYDSGAMPYAQEHFPFADVKRRERPAAFPADYISEGIDQTRGWFYTLVAIATALGYPAPFKNVVCLGLVNDKNGQKMSKSKGNIVEPFAVIHKYGVDAVRWYLYTNSPLGEPKNFDEGDIQKTFRRVHLIVYNSLVFWKTYALRAAQRPAKSANILDQWILARLAETVTDATKQLERYEIRDAALAIETLVDDLSRWFIRRSRRRLQKPDSKTDYGVASATLGHVLRELAKLMAPFSPFFAESIYQGLGEKESVHLDTWPIPEKKLLDPKLVAAMADTRRIASAALAKRAELGIKVRQPLAELRVKSAALRSELVEILKDEVNVKKITFGAKMASELEFDTVITPELKAEGILRDLVRMVQELRQNAGFQAKDAIVLMMEAPGIHAVLSENEKFLKTEVGAKTIEYRRGKFTAEAQTKLDGADIWLGVRKV
ncbi:MAG: hypothetical protein RL681_793 [Candidatus Parcubacteria bacterium]|jgi:isoleucyl-tRNA synthetase